MQRDNKREEYANMRKHRRNIRSAAASPKPDLAKWIDNIYFPKSGHT
jgi:hypothetical protein